MWIGNDILPRSFGNPEPVWIPAPSGGSSYVFLVEAAASSSDTNGVTTASRDTTGANLIVISVGSYNVNTAPTLTDSKSNTWTPLTANAATGIVRVQQFYCYSPSVGSGHTFSANGIGSFPDIAMQAFSGAAASPFDIENANGNTSSLTLQPGSVTPSVNGELLVTAIMFNGVGAVASINSSFSTPVQVMPVVGTSFGFAQSYKIQGTASAENPTWTLTSTDVNGTAANIATFKPV